MKQEPAAKPKAAPAGPAAVKTRRVSKAPKKEHRYVLAVSIGFFVALSLGILAAVLADPTWISSRLSAQKAPPEPAARSQIGTITLDPGSASNCRKMIFDNQTGRVTETNTPCEQVVRDETGAPKPVGTLRRLDAISKSFSR